MFTLTPYMLSSLNLFLLAIAMQNPPPYIPTDLILLNCGTPSNTTSLDGRNWEGDPHSKYLGSSNSPTPPPASEPSSLDPLATLVIPYTTARISHSRFTYRFPVSPGPKFVRLYFYPATYSGLNPLTSLFVVIFCYYQQEESKKHVMHYTALCFPFLWTPFPSLCLLGLGVLSLCLSSVELPV